MRRGAAQVGLTPQDLRVGGSDVSLSPVPDLLHDHSGTSLVASLNFPICELGTRTPLCQGDHSSSTLGTALIPES